MSDWNQQIMNEFRANDGKVGGVFKDNTLLILHTTGAKTGKERENPLVTYEDGDQLVIIASAGGATSHPDWYHNLRANPIVEVEYGTEVFKARAEETSEPERTRLYEGMERRMDSFSDYKKTADRVIPVLKLTRLD